jgi:hypothetical protein
VACGVVSGRYGNAVGTRVAVSAISGILTEVGDARWEQNFNDLKQQFSQDNECKDEDEDDEDDDDDDEDSDDSEDRDYPKKKKKIAKPKYIWDPSGYVYEVTAENRIEGVTTTILEQDAASGQFCYWDAAEYLQKNPLTTDAEGRYAWDVPAGYWQVIYEKEAYCDWLCRFAARSHGDCARGGDSACHGD